MLLGVEDIMLDATFLEHRAQFFGNLNGNRADQHRLSGLMHLRDAFHDCVKFRGLLRKDRVVKILSDDRLVGRDHHNVHVIDIAEFVLFRLCRTGHTCQLVVHPKIVLQRDGRQRLGLGTDQYALLRLDRLMQTVAVASAEHQTTCKLIDDDDFSVLNDVVHIALHDRLCLECLDHMMVDLHVFRIAEVLNLEELFCLGDALIGQTDAFFLFLDRIVGVLALIQRIDKFVRDPIQIRRFITLSGNDQRRSRLIDEDRVHFVDDRVVQISLRQLILVNDHVVAQIIKAEFVVGSVGNIGPVRGLAGLV